MTVSKFAPCLANDQKLTQKLEKKIPNLVEDGFHMDHYLMLGFFSMLFSFADYIYFVNVPIDS